MLIYDGFFLYGGVCLLKNAMFVLLLEKSATNELIVKREFSVNL